MEMTFQQYIDNPMGKSNAVFSQRSLFKERYTEKFNAVFLREAGNIVYNLYYDKDHDIYAIHMKIPAEEVSGVYYDVALKFYTKSPEIHAAPTLDNYFVRFFSNDPGFVYTYMYVFEKEDMFFDELRARASRIALRRAPDVRNKYQVPGYSKIIYFAYLFMKLKNLFNKTFYRTNGLKYSPRDIMANIADAETKLAERDDAGKAKRKEQQMLKRMKQKEKPIKTDDSGDLNQSVTKTSRIAKMTSSVKKTGTVKRTATTKTVRRTKGK